MDRGWSWCWVTMGRHRWVPGLYAAWMSDDPEMVQSSDPRNPQHIGEMEISWKAVLRQKGTEPSGRWKK